MPPTNGDDGGPKGDGPGGEGPKGDEPDGEGSDDDGRRRVLTYAGLALLGAGGLTGAWVATRPDEAGEEPTPTETPTPTEEPTPTETPDPTDQVPPLVERYAPDLYFGALEKWFPTDPRTHVPESDDDLVVDGITALENYSTAFEAPGRPPDPVVFYRVVEAADGVDAIQYWLYSVFDQFTVNFHWHDWELLQVFVDRSSGEPLLVSASAHSRSVPNNEFLEPDLGDPRRPGILSEVGSHSSGSEVNDVVPSFERVSTADWLSDVTNDEVGIAENLAAPFAYGLPRDEGARLPFVMPELDGHRLDDHPDVSVEREDFVDERVTVDSWRGLPQPPADIPLRVPGLVLAHPDSAVDADATYTLDSIEGLAGEITDFVGPQLSFEFAIPGFVEDHFANHITSVGIPWTQDRYDDPLSDVTDPAHRRRIAGEAPQELSDRVVGRLRQLGSGASGALGQVADGAREAIEDQVSVSLHGLPVEVAVRLASDGPEATVTRDGTFGLLGVESGEHELVVNGPGFAPLASRFEHDGGTVQVGSGGDLALVATEDAGWIEGDGRPTDGVSHVRVVEDFAGVVYDGQPVEDDRFAVAVHREGHYTVEVSDSNGRAGAYRVTPASFDDGEAARETVETGKASLVRTLGEEIAEVLTLARSFVDGEGQDTAVIGRLASAREEAAGAETAVEEGQAGAADERLSSVVALLEEALELLGSDTQRAFGEAAVVVLRRRIDATLDRTEAAITTELA